MSKLDKQLLLERLTERGVVMDEVAQIVFDLQIKYYPELTMELCLKSLHAVLEKREIQHAILVGIELDVLAEKGLLSSPLQELIQYDEPLFGIDETIAVGACMVYGSISVTSFGYLDKLKPGCIRKFDTKDGKQVNTFLDDMVSAIAAAAASRIAHHLRDSQGGK